MNVRFVSGNIFKFFNFFIIVFTFNIVVSTRELFNLIKEVNSFHNMPSKHGKKLKVNIVAFD